MKHRFTVLLSGVLALILALGGLPGLVLPARAETTVPVVKSITDTGVEAEAVMAAGEGYACLMVSAHYDADGSLASLPQAALMERSGFLVMPYTETWHYYFVDDGVISLASNLYRSYSGGQPASF